MKHTTIYCFSALLWIGIACTQQARKTSKDSPAIERNSTIEEQTTADKQATDNEIDPKQFIPKGYKVFETVKGDLNADGKADLVYVVKNTLATAWVVDEQSGEKVDRNRRGLIVVLQGNKGYTLAVANSTCLSSENEDGGVYYAPELSVSIKKNKLYLNYEHGRYGFWQYTFRLKGNDMELIGFDNSENEGPVVKNEISINFLTREKHIKQNTNVSDEAAEEPKFVTYTEKISMKLPILLSGIKNMDELYF